MIQHTRFMIVLLGAVALLTLAACGNAPASPATEVRLSVAGREMTFTPTQVRATVGQPITVEFVNEGVVEHDWAVLKLAARDVRATVEGAGGTHQTGTGDGSNPSVHVAAMPGERGEVTFTAEQPGRYTIGCTVPGHKEAGMMGMLTVAE
jgi:uncharacterized cupredoxin-like copper-binding protein